MTKLSQQDIKDLKETYPNINPALLLDGEQPIIIETHLKSPVVQNQPIKRSKYNAVPTVYNGIRYASKKEANHAIVLNNMLKAGDVDYILRQVPFDLGAGITYRADFLTLKCGFIGDLPVWDVKVYEVKGMETPAWKLKHKLFKEHYPLIQLEVV